MPAVLPRAALFMLVAVVIHLVLSAAYVGTAGRAHRAVQLDEAFFASRVPLDLLVVGGSHARNALDDEELPNTLNLAVGGEHPVKSYYRLRWLLSQQHRRVRAVALSFDVTTFSPFKADHYAPEWVWGRYIDFWELGMRKRKPFAYGGRQLKAKAVPYAGEVETLLQYARGVKAFRDERGTGRFGALPALTQATLAEEVVGRHFAGDAPVDPSKRWAFLSTIQLLRASDVRIVLISYPLTRQYSESARALGAHAAMEQAVTSRYELVATSTTGDAAKEEGRRVLADPLEHDQILHLDYEALLHDSDNHLFLDPDHLNARGQAAFTELVHHQLRRRRFWHRRKAVGGPD